MELRGLDSWLTTDPAEGRDPDAAEPFFVAVPLRVLGLVCGGCGRELARFCWNCSRRECALSAPVVGQVEVDAAFTGRAAFFDDGRGAFDWRRRVPVELTTEEQERAELELHELATELMEQEAEEKKREGGRGEQR